MDRRAVVFNGFMSKFQSPYGEKMTHCILHDSKHEYASN